MEYGIIENCQGGYDLVNLNTKELIKCNQSFNYAHYLADRLNAGDYNLLIILESKYKN